ncbi:MAG: CvpA family protein [Clostridia bacterium]|nr:CvpA family protein [Clostridia bacterium]
MGIIVDLIIIGILSLAVFYGYKKGLVKVAVRFCTTIIAVIAVIILCTPISNLIINATNIDETIENSVYKNVTAIVEKEKKEKEKGNYVQELEGKLIEDAKNNVLQPTARNIAINAIRFAVIIVLFLGIKFGLIFVKALADLITKLPIVKQFDKAGGVVYGIILGFTIIFISLEVIKIAVNLNPQNVVEKPLSESYIGNILYQNNVIDIFLK